jgi:hypothetical protein
MAAPTIQDIFGQNAYVSTDGNAVVNASDTNPVLVIGRNDFTEWTDVDTSKPERWIAAILNKLVAFDVADGTDVPDVECTIAARILALRNGTDKMGFIFQTTVYQAVSGLPVSPDPDLI